MLKKKIYFRTLLFSIVFFIFLFLPAGSFNFWEAWIYFVIFLGSTFIINGYFLKRDPELIERRSNAKEKEKEQKIFQTISGISFVGLLVLPSLDYRFGWSNVPLFILFVADVIVLLGFSIVFFVFKENSYTSAIIEVKENQKVITTGPYALVRHPMYTGAIFIILFTPLALGSIWAVIPSITIIIFIVLRLLNEEKVLLKELKGYEEYCKKTRYHLIPFIW
ncbi:methyltransferase family protein [Paenibacillus radicis (ex Xue et al. 2023)]|uniref:Isoprenylcysteine carboxylmethyltransferase family protein n=1 Tax=Paenibacillus radicis (ex Xue et al. 2023) TaxID=2972489 RepID=A0ABT1YAC4_9BACL|nr:isoprenylcysteine carboxylmethyltransferase family protein [Paenibacillus radicis (ex Xue et al. 2023)]MCR8630144.1 isoprenylcysteine carboxylmethyltransferase family protein [Paenibacillus radicis (ex Xue et al. 2023)]